MSKWSAQQHSYRSLMVALRAAYYHDRHRLFWARHKVKVEIYKYASIPKEAENPETALLLGVSKEVAQFIETHMKFTVERIIDHNDTMLKLPVAEAKKFRQEYYDKEREHDSWCRGKIRTILDRRPPPPFPYS